MASFTELEIITGVEDMVMSQLMQQQTTTKLLEAPVHVGRLWKKQEMLEWLPSFFSRGRPEQEVGPYVTVLPPRGRILDSTENRNVGECSFQYSLIITSITHMISYMSADAAKITIPFPRRN